MRYEILNENNDVVNTVVADIDFVQANFKHYRQIEELIVVEQTKIPQILTPRQCKLQLLTLGLLDEVEAIIATDRALKIWFDESLDFQRSNTLIIAVALQLRMSEDDMDNFFIEASKL